MARSIHWLLNAPEEWAKRNRRKWYREQKMRAQHSKFKKEALSPKQIFTMMTKAPTSISRDRRRERRRANDATKIRYISETKADTWSFYFLFYLAKFKWARQISETENDWSFCGTQRCVLPLFIKRIFKSFNWLMAFFLLSRMPIMCGRRNEAIEFKFKNCSRIHLVNELMVLAKRWRPDDFCVSLRHAIQKYERLLSFQSSGFDSPDYFPSCYKRFSAWFYTFYFNSNCVPQITFKIEFHYGHFYGRIKLAWNFNFLLFCAAFWPAQKRWHFTNALETLQ